MDRRNLVTGEIFHILNRGVDKRDIFLDDQDYIRFIHDLFEFNDVEAVLNLNRSFQSGQLMDLRNPSIRKPRKFIVEILAFCLMPNHFHLMLRQKEDGGITKFMRRLGIGYANYFNQKYERTGTLFQGRFKSILVTEENHFIHLPYYIHFNPLDLTESDWRTGKINDYQKAMNFLNSYRWSSHLDYIGKKNFPSIISTKFLNEIWGGSQKYKLDFNKSLRDFSKFNVYNEENLD